MMSLGDQPRKKGEIMPEKQILAKKIYVDNSLDNVLRDVDGVVSIPNTKIELSQKIVTTTEEDPDTHEEVTTDEIVTESYLDRTKLHVEDSYASKTAEYGVNEIKLNGSTITGITDNTSGSSSTLAVSQRALSNFKQVEANPVGTPTADLTTIKIDNTIYELDAGSDVEANPQDSATDELTKLKIDDTIYDVGNTKEQELTMAQYNALSQAEKMNGTNYLITDANESSGGGNYFSPEIYSTEEREIGVWTDGKPIYQKTYFITTPSSTSSANLIDITDLNLESLIFLQGSVYYPPTTISHNANYLDLALWVRTKYNGTDIDYIAGRCQNSEYCNKNASITLKYTKTTDTPGSGSWTPSGIPAVHYSTDEQIIGTWIDGSTLYQKTFNISGPSVSNDLLSDLDIKFLISGYFLIWSGHEFKQVPIQYNDATKLITNNPQASWYLAVIVEYTKNITE